MRTAAAFTSGLTSQPMLSLHSSYELGELSQWFCMMTTS